MKKKYIITKRTKLIKVSESTYYRSCIIDVLEDQNDMETYSFFKPVQIIDYNCKLYGANLDGRKEVVKEILNSTSKVPIPVIPQQGIYFFPTASTKNKDCVWLAYHHIKSYENLLGQTYVTFHDGTSMVLDISPAIFDKQYKRASQVIVYFNRFFLFGQGPRLW